MASSASVGAGAGVSIRPKAEVVLIGLKSAGMNGQWGVTGTALNAKGRWYVTSVTTCVLRAAPSVHLINHTRMLSINLIKTRSPYVLLVYERVESGSLECMHIHSEEAAVFFFFFFLKTKNPLFNPLLLQRLCSVDCLLVLNPNSSPHSPTFLLLAFAGLLR